MELGELAGILSESEATAHKAESYGALEGLRLAVGDVERRRHLVGVAGRKSSRRELDVAYHIGIDDAETLLLAAPHELWTVDLHSVDVDGILVKRSASDGILRAHLVAAVHARHRGEHRLHAASRHVGRQLVALGVESLHAVDVVSESGHLHLGELSVFGIHPDVDGQLPLGLDELMVDGLEADAAEYDVDGVAGSHRQLIETLKVGVGADRGAGYPHGGEFHRLVLVVDHLAADFHVLPPDGGERHQQCRQ